MTDSDTEQKEKEKESQNEIPTDGEIKGTKKRVRVRDKMKTLEERKKGKQKFIRNIYRGNTKIKK